MVAILISKGNLNCFTSFINFSFIFLKAFVCLCFLHICNFLVNLSIRVYVLVLHLLADIKKNSLYI